MENFGEKCVDQDNVEIGDKFDFGKRRHKTKSQHRKNRKMHNFINPIKHKPIFMVFGAGFEQHKSKKCPINGQNLLKYIRYFIQAIPDIVRQIAIPTHQNHPSFPL